MIKQNEDRLDLADWLISEGYGTPYRVSVEGKTASNDHFTIPCLGKSIMAIRLTYFNQMDMCISETDIETWGKWYILKEGGREDLYKVNRHKIDLEYLTENAWVRFVSFTTRVLREDTLEEVADPKRFYKNLQSQMLSSFEDKIKKLIDHMITFHGLTLV